MRKRIRWILALIALASFAVALSYPIRHEMELRRNREGMEALSAMRSRNRVAETAPPEPTPAPERTAGPAPAATQAPELSARTAEATAEAPTAAPTAPENTAVPDGPAVTQEAIGTAEPAPIATESPAAESSPEPTVEVVMPGYILYDLPGRTPEPTREPAPRAVTTPAPEETPAPTPSPDRRARDGALPYPDKEKVALDEARILPELREIWELNHDLAGWLCIPGTNVDYPVVQSADSEFYLHHDFYGEKNSNGQIILDPNCDLYTPSYNLVISGHRMDSGAMFGYLPRYFEKERSWRDHKIVEFDTLMERKRYVVFAAFYSADWDENEEGFRYNADIQYRLETEHWLEEIRANQLYDTGIDAEFGDEFITLTTCSRAHHREGRFVVVCRRIREGEEF